MTDPYVARIGYDGADRLRVPYVPYQKRQEATSQEAPVAAESVSESPPTPKAPDVKVKRIPTTGVYRIAGEAFTVRATKTRVRILHPKWSLIGTGKTFAAAERDLVANAGIVARVYGRLPAASLDREATKMYAFALRIA